MGRLHLGEDTRDTLRHVLWIGGPPDSGKTTIANILAERYGLQVYHFDRHEPDHDSRVRRASPAKYPYNHAWDAKTLDELWVAGPPSAMAELVVGCWSERIGLVTEDLLAMSTHRPIVAEGPGFFPEVVLPLLSHPRQAVWLVPSEAFKRASHERRGKSFGDEVSDPNRATRNHIERDLLMAEHYRQKTRELSLAVYEVDGAKSVEEMAALVEARFAPLLSLVDPV